MTQGETADYEIGNLERRAADLHRAGLLADVRDEVEDIDTVLSQLPSQLQEARTRGYVFKSYLEEQIESLHAQWDAERGNTEREIERRARDLEGDLARAERAVRQLAALKGRSLSSAQSTLNRVEGELDSLERQVDAAIDAVRGMYDSLYAQVRDARGQVEESVELLDTMDQASFGFRHGEAGIAAVEAKWLKDGRSEGPKGVLLLTDQRIIFEQREKVAKKKILFITTASEEVQELQWEAPLAALKDADATEKRQALVMKKEHLALEFGSPATIREVVLELREDSEAWRALVGRAVSGEMDRERVAGSKEAADTEAARHKVPTRCPNCGASLEVTATRGITAIECTFCGTAIPLGDG